jgi:hypothetical protein
MPNDCSKKAASENRIEREGAGARNSPYPPRNAL